MPVASRFHNTPTPPMRATGKLQRSNARRRRLPATPRATSGNGSADRRRKSSAFGPVAGTTTRSLSGAAVKAAVATAKTTAAAARDGSGTGTVASTPPARQPTVPSWCVKGARARYRDGKVCTIQAVHPYLPGDVTSFMTVVFGRRGEDARETSLQHITPILTMSRGRRGAAAAAPALDDAFGIAKAAATVAVPVWCAKGAEVLYRKSGATCTIVCVEPAMPGDTTTFVTVRFYTGGPPRETSIEHLLEATDENVIARCLSFDGHL